MSSDLGIVTPTRISIKDDPHLNEFWLQDQIVDGKMGVQSVAI